MREYDANKQIVFDTSGLDDFQKELNRFLKAAEEKKVTRVLKHGADAFTSDLLKLPKPRSRIHAAGYTHMVSTFTNRIAGNEVEVGWGKYYGPMVERGTIKMKGQPHLRPTFKSNSQKYYKIMTDELWKGV